MAFKVRTTFPVLQTDISPDETQMLDWIVTAAKSNKFSLVHKGGANGMLQCHQCPAHRSQLMQCCIAGLAHLEAKIAAGGFTIDIRWAI